MSLIQCEVSLLDINQWKIILLPLSESSKLSSRGMVMASGTINGIDFTTWLEPDGNGSHWFKVEDSFIESNHIYIDSPILLHLDPLKNWLEPEIPDDIFTALSSADLLPVWYDLTTKARWEWIRWIRSTHNSDTRKKRIEVTCSKLESGKRRPCCFDQTQCTVTQVSKGGILLVL